MLILLLISQIFGKAKLLLDGIETTEEEVSMHINYKKIEYMIYHTDDGDLRIRNGVNLKMKDLKYLSSWIQSSEIDMKKRIRHAWTSLNKMAKNWRSNHPNCIKIEFFRATKEIILFHGGEG